MEKIFLKKPVFIFTADIDWCSESGIYDLINYLNFNRIKPLVFVTHKSKILAKLKKKNFIDLGIHPNFLPNSSHGIDIQEIINFCLDLTGKTLFSRSHSFHENSWINIKLYESGIRFDSNLCCYLEKNLKPIRHFTNIIKLPVFWEDDIHLLKNGNLDFNNYIKYFKTPGLKVINIHPFLFSYNIKNMKHYYKNKSKIQTLSIDEIHKQEKKEGLKNFIYDMVNFIKQKNYKILDAKEITKII